MKIGIEEKTILHYAKKIKEYCDRQGDFCGQCPIYDDKKEYCYFNDVPFMWEEVNLHNE